MDKKKALMVGFYQAPTTPFRNKFWSARLTCAHIFLMLPKLPPTKHRLTDYSFRKRYRNKANNDI